ncbi:PilW family protein [Candidatus Auribacterota bacterium]
MKKKKRRVNKSQGFTLIELLIAASIFSVAIVVVYSTFSTGIMAFKRGENYSDQSHSIRLSLNKMVRDLRNAIYSSDMTIVGSAKELYCYTILEEKEKDSLNLSGIYKVSYSFEAGKAVFLRKEEPYISTLRLIGTIISKRQEIPEKISDFKFEYFGKVFEVEEELREEELGDKGTLVEKWTDKWKFENGFPGRIKITFSLPEKKTQKKIVFNKIINLYRGTLWEEIEEVEELLEEKKEETFMDTSFTKNNKR